MLAKVIEWLRNHSTAILITLTAAQNWHFFGGKADAVFLGAADMLQNIGTH